MSDLSAPIPFAGLSEDAPPDNPRWDPDFADRCLVDLMQHWGQWRRLGRLYAGRAPSFDRCCVVREAVEHGRRLGMDIEGDRRRGYRIVGFHRPARIYLLQPGAPPRTEPEPQIPGQLLLVEGVE